METNDIRPRRIYLHSENYQHIALEPYTTQPPVASIMLDSDGLNDYIDGRQVLLLGRIPGTTKVRAVVYGDPNVFPRPIVEDLALDVELWTGEV